MNQSNKLFFTHDSHQFIWSKLIQNYSLLILFSISNVIVWHENKILKLSIKNIQIKKKCL